MRLLLIIMLLPIFSIGQFDTTKFYRSPNVGEIFRRAKINALMLPGDTTTNKVGVAQIGANLYAYFNSKWNVVGGVDTTLLASKAFTNATYALRNRAIVAGYGLAGGGDLSADRSFIVDSTVIASKDWSLAQFPQLSLQYNNPSWVATLLDSKLRSFSATNGQFLRYNGTTYVPTTLGSGAYTDSLRYLKGTGISGRVPFYTSTNTLSNDTSLTFNNASKKFNISKAYIGGADTLFANDPYQEIINTLKIGGVAHQYGIARDGTNGGMDYTFFKENGDVNGNRTPIIANRRVLPGQEISYHQYSAHNGLDSIFSKRSIAAITSAYPSYNSRLGDLHGWYQITTARDSGYKASPATLDVVISEGRVAFNAPTNLRNSDMVRTAQVYGSLSTTDSLLTPNVNIFGGGNFYTQYVNGGDLGFKRGSSAFDILKIRESNRPIIIQGGASHVPLYFYTDASSVGFTQSLTQITGYTQSASAGTFSIANNEILRFDNVAGARVGINTGSGNNATFDIRGSTSSTRAFLVKDNNSVELFRVNNAGNVIVNPTIGNLLVGTSTDAGFKADINGTCRVTGVLTIGTITIRTGTGSPEGSVTATVGSQFMRTDGGANTTLYVKESGTGNTGWVAK
jgi:hypothetical protein